MPSEEREGGEGGSGIVPELRLLWSLAWPSGLSMVLRMGTMQTTMIVVGHMGTEELAAVALGNMWVAMVGMTLVYGGFSGLDTLASQAYGAKNYAMVGLWTQRAVVIVCITCVFLVPLWWFATTPCLILAGIPPENAVRAGEFAKVQICWMFPAFMNRCVQSFWRAQRIVKPYDPAPPATRTFPIIRRMSMCGGRYTNCSYISFLLHIPTTWYFCQWWGFEGAAWSLPVNQWLLFLSLLAYDRWKGLSVRCWGGWSRECLRDLSPLLKLAAGGTLVMLGDAWGYFTVQGMSGVLGTIPLAAHVILQSINQLLLPVSMGIGQAANTRVGNLLGAGDGRQASLVLRLSLVFALVVQCLLSGVIYSLRERVAYIYSTDEEVIQAVARCALIFAFFQATNGWQGHSDTFSMCLLSSR